jgi:DNA-binding transcriptional LysR family regulator
MVYSANRIMERRPGVEEVDLRDLTAFVTVARHRNFRRAAIELRMSPSALSENLRDLEERLGVRLLNRTTRSVAPTEAGERLLTRLGPALRDVRDAVSDIQSQRDIPAGRLRINAATPAVQHVLAPMVAPFLKRFPGIQLEIMDDSALIDIVAEGFDAGVRFEENLARDMVAVSLGPPQRYALAASPTFLAEHGRPQKPEDVLGSPCIVTRFPSGIVLPWEFEKGGREVKFVPTGTLACMNSSLQLQAAVDGLGFVMTFEETIRAAVKSGLLETVLDDWLPSFPGPFLYYPSRRQAPPTLAAFISFVTEWRRRKGRP